MTLLILYIHFIRDYGRRDFVLGRRLSCGRCSHFTNYGQHGTAGSQCFGLFQETSFNHDIIPASRIRWSSDIRVPSGDLNVTLLTANSVDAITKAALLNPQEEERHDASGGESINGSFYAAIFPAHAYWAMGRWCSSLFSFSQWSRILR